MRECAKCKFENPDFTPYCARCGSELTPGVVTVSDGVDRDVLHRQDEPSVYHGVLDMPGKKSFAVPGGIVVVIAGMMMIVMALITAFQGRTIGDIFGSDLEGWVYALAATEFVFGIITMQGGRCAIRKRQWVFALLTAVIPMVFGGALLILGVLGVVFIAVSKDDFKT